MSFEDDFEWQEQFRGHYSEISLTLTRFTVAPPEDDWRRNTDFVLSLDTLLGNRPARISARARRPKYWRYRGQFTIRLERPSRADTEMAKVRAGYGDFMIYGHASDTEPGRLAAWCLLNLNMVRGYLANGGYWKKQHNPDGSSDFAVFWLDDMPLGTLVAEQAMPPVDHGAVWGQCRRCYRRYVAPTDDDGHLADGVGRWCMFCGFRWRSGRVMRLEATVGKAVTALDADPFDLDAVRLLVPQEPS